MVHVINDYYIDVNSMNYVAVKKNKSLSGKKIGEDYTVTLGYFGTIQDAVQEIVNSIIVTKLDKTKVIELSEALLIHKKEYSKFTKLLNKATKEVEEREKTKKVPKNKAVR